MRPLIPLLASLLVVTSLHAKEEMEQIKDEARDFAKGHGNALRKMMTKADPQEGIVTFSKEDLLCEEDKGKTFDPESAFGEPDLKAFIHASSKKERLEGTEAFLADSRKAIVNPNSQLEIVAQETKLNSVDERFETCQEAGTYQLLLTQRRIVEVIPATTEQITCCKGHEEHEKFHLEKNAKEYRKKKEKELFKDATIASSKVKISEGGLTHRYEVTSSWSHKEGIGCKRSYVEQRVLGEATEKDFWETDDPEALSSLSASPHCKMLYSQLLSGPETRSINGSAIFRDSWERQLFFSCGDELNSKCAKLREQGAQIYRKKCLRKTSFTDSECDLWEKVYRISKGNIGQETTTSFNGQEIWGLNGSFDSSYEANADFATALTTLEVFSDIKQDIEHSNTDFLQWERRGF